MYQRLLYLGLGFFIAILPIYLVASPVEAMDNKEGNDSTQASTKAEGQTPVPTAHPPLGSYYNPTQSFAPMVDTVKDAVVAIEVEKTGFSGIDPMGVPPIFRDFFANDPRLNSPYVMQGEGSGFIVSSDGLVLTNFHVVKGATEIQARLNDGTQVALELLGGDENIDVALLKLSGDQEWPHLTLQVSKEARVGDWVLAMGNPLGLGYTVTAGIISGKGRVLGQDYFGSDDFIQTDAAINRGNSGGPLLDLSGQVVGMNTAIIDGANTVGFAIPSSLISKIMGDLKEHGSVARGYLGVRPQPLDENLATSMGAESTNGALIAQVFDDTPARTHGLKPGDIVLEIDKKEVQNPEDLVRLVSSHRPDEEIELTVLRNKQKRTIALTLAKRPGPDDSQQNNGRSPQDMPDDIELLEDFGIQLGTVKAQASKKGGKPNGAIILRVSRTSPAFQRLIPGDVILEVEGKSIDSAQDVAQILRGVPKKEVIQFLIRRQNGQQFVAVPVRP